MGLGKHKDFFFLEFGNPGQVNKKKKIIEHQVEGCKPGSA